MKRKPIYKRGSLIICSSKNSFTSKRSFLSAAILDASHLLQKGLVPYDQPTSSACRCIDLDMKCHVIHTVVFTQQKRPTVKRLLSPIKNRWVFLSSSSMKIEAIVLIFRRSNLASWWFQPLWRILVKMGSSSPLFWVKIPQHIFENHHPVGFLGVFYLKTETRVHPSIISISAAEGKFICSNSTWIPLQFGGHPNLEQLKPRWHGEKEIRNLETNLLGYTC